MLSTQVNFRIPFQLKQQAQSKAEAVGMNLSEIMKLFLEKFTNEDVFRVAVKHDIKWEEIFDQGVVSHIMSTKGKQMTQKINSLLADDEFETIIQNTTVGE